MNFLLCTWMVEPKLNCWIHQTSAKSSVCATRYFVRVNQDKAVSVATVETKLQTPMKYVQLSLFGYDAPYCRHYSKRAVQPICAVQNWKLCSYLSMNYYEKLRNVRPNITLIDMNSVFQLH